MPIYPKRFCPKCRTAQDHEIKKLTYNILKFTCKKCGDIELFNLFNQDNIKVPMTVMKRFISDEKEREFLKEKGYLDQVEENIVAYEEVVNGRRNNIFKPVLEETTSG